ncbi:MAG: SMI1/KNR4 family protein [Planctomycetaceae bacterium]|nr:SMI1/KNR4 family protein [Planctomycetaceae bacterium]
MTKDEIRSLLERCLTREATGFSPPTEQEWKSLEDRFDCKLPSELRDFIDLMAEYSFPGEILNVGAGPNNGNDTIEVAYEYEIEWNPSWAPTMVPFYSVGNGDYFCVSSKEGPASPAFYYDHDRGEFKAYADSIKNWIADLPNFLR